jgi:large subunit ribosomal protein L21
MFAIVRTGGKQYRVAAGDKIAVEKIAGEAGDTVTLSDVLMSGEGGDVKGVGGVTVAAEIIAQAKGDKVIVFKKRRRHNYRRKQGHRQQYTILKIVAIGDQKVETKKAAPAKTAKVADAPAQQEAPAKVETAEAAAVKAPKAKKQTAPAAEASPAETVKSEPTAGEIDAPKKKSTKKAKSATDAADGNNQA